MKILIIKLHYIGDVVMITPALRRLRRAFPEAQIDVLIGKWSRQVIDHNPHVDKIISVPDGLFRHKDFRNLQSLYRLLHRLRSEKYDSVLIFHRNRWIHRFGRSISAPMTIGYRASGEDTHRYSFWDVKQHGVLNALSLVDTFCREMGIDPLHDDNNGRLRAEWIVTADEMQRAGEVFEAVGVDSPPIIVHPGAGVPGRKKGIEKQWFPDRFVDLIEAMQRQNVGPILLEGAEFERPLAEGIQERLSVPVGSIVGMTNLRELAAVLSRSRLLITNDTGTMHVGGAVGVPLVGIFGSTGREKFLPLDGPFRAVQSSVPCSPCTFGGFKGCINEEFECLKEISVERVLDAAMELLS